MNSLFVGWRNNSELRRKGIAMNAALDLAGRIFGQLTVIERAGKNKTGQTLWRCQCICGKERYIPTSSLTTGNTRSCGCSTGRYVEEIPGTRYGRLTIIRRGPNKRDSRGIPRGATWVCQCDCGNTTTVSGRSLRDGNTTSCGCLRRERALERVTKPTGVAAGNRAISTMKANAANRGLSWELTELETLSLMRQPCHYCGAEPSNVGKSRSGSIQYSGIDRIDSDKGYVADNVVPCCFVCNNAKRTMSVDEFLAWIERVYLHSCSGKARER